MKLFFYYSSSKIICRNTYYSTGRSIFESGSVNCDGNFDLPVYCGERRKSGYFDMSTNMANFRNSIVASIFLLLCDLALHESFIIKYLKTK